MTKKDNDQDEVFEYPKWHDCQWKREACNKVDCPLCGRILKHNEKMKLQGKDPDGMESALECVQDSFAETFMMLEEMAEKKGLDLEELSKEPDNWEEREKTDEHPLYKAMNQWTLNVYKFLEKVDDNGSLWLHTEAGKDLSWYHSMITAKVYRQLCSRWDIDNFDDWVDYDYIYTKGVIKEILRILYDAFDYLNSFGLPNHELNELNKFFAELQSLEKDILSI
ncbi:hypothetical protein KJ742_07020 [Patescibacteria group bacterium]|nr:hypothetical protein [Patescibacteria group bacterium]MBU1683664.1 hypothetical protein [Patescibacteria group bacterium]MBU1935717.1 hypothetical protein [Patescibacteria group bacterium]